MTTYTKPEIDWSTFPDSDGEPMAENHENLVQMIDLIFAVQRLCERQGRIRTMVGGNQLLYYNRHNGRDHVSPDVYAAFDMTPPPPPKWRTWIQGKSPDIVWEISSPSTRAEDVGTKRDLYARLGVQEYYIFDPLDESQSALLGYALRDKRLEPLPTLPSGGIMSRLLGAELRPVVMAATKIRLPATYLRVIDPWTGAPILVPEEAYQDFDEVSREYAKARQDILVAEERAETEARTRQEAQRQANEAQRQAAEAQQRADAEVRARIALEQRVDVEVRIRQADEQARRVAEERAEQAEAALRAALTQLDRRQSGDSTSTGSDA